MKIYVASLSDYNAGILHGKWFDLDDYTDADDLQDDIQEQILNTSPTAKAEGVPAEEFAIHDYEDGVDGLGEYESLEDLIELNDALYEHGDAYRAYIDNVGRNGASVKDFEDKYRGHYNSKEDFAYEILVDSGDMSQVPEHLRDFIDLEAYARYLFDDSFDWVDGYVFWSN